MADAIACNDAETLANVDVRGVTAPFGYKHCKYMCAVRQNNKVCILHNVTRIYTR